jgi:hypothetical protein
MSDLADPDEPDGEILELEVCAATHAEKINSSEIKI